MDVGYPPHLRGMARGHLHATMMLFERLAFVAGGHPAADDVRYMLSRPQDLPVEVDERDSLLKYDAYMACGDRLKWGVTVNDRWEKLPLAVVLSGLARHWGYDMSTYIRLRNALEHTRPALCVSTAFGHPADPPSLKLYLQEDVWEQGVASWGELRQAIVDLAPYLILPDWIPPERRVGVVTVQPSHNHNVALKVYLGAPTPHEAAKHAPASAQRLADDMAAASSLTPAYHYLTVRLSRSSEARYAINKIYNAVAIVRDDDEQRAAACWQDVERLFELANQGKALARLRGQLDDLDGWVLPTATALENESRSADVYIAAWPRRERRQP